jgi:CRP-like cAMP-binding protein
MGFETEKLRLKPDWHNPDLFPAHDQQLNEALRGLAKYQAQSRAPFTLQQVISHFHMNGPPVKLKTIQRMVEFLCERHLIENSSAHSWVSVLRRGAPRPSLKVWFDRLRMRAKEVLPAREEWESLPIIRQLDAGLRAQVLKNAKVRRFTAGVRLCRQGGNDRELMILFTGQAAVVRRRKTGKETVAILEAGAVFGEISYFLNEPRTADVVAMSEGAVLCIPPPEGGKEADVGMFKALQTRIWFLQALQRNPLFEDMPAEAFDALLLHGHEEKFVSGQTIVQQGAPADACYFLIQGKVRVLQGGKEINRLTTGSVIGEIGLMFETGGRTASVVADSPVIAIKYSWAEYWDVLSAHLVLGVALEGLAEKRLARDEAREA